MNSGSRHARLEALFHEALELPAEAIPAFLDEIAATDATLADDLRDLLARDAETGEPVTPLFTTGEEPVRAIGPYRLLRRLGEGGFGSVWEAEQTAPVRRHVAIKILKAGMDSRAILGRFEAERQALALMDHPGIAQVFDAGQTPDGRPYFVMELVPGESITRDCDRHRRPLAERLRLFVMVCRAVEHAHQKGVIHRDLKPSNILVVADGERPRIKVIDFGIAKAARVDAADGTLLTRAGEILGTPEYMSPEQAASGGVDVDTRSDVYSLGVVLFRLLTGRLPFASDRLRHGGVLEMARILSEEDAPRPSDVAATEHGNDPTPAPAPARALKGDLDWIVGCALEKDRNRRYASAAALADDIERQLRHETVLASPPSTTYRLQKLMRRHRALVTGVASVFAVLLLGLAGTTIQAWRATRAEEESRRQAEIATAVSEFLGGMLAAADPERNPRGREVTVREIVDRAAVQLRGSTGLDTETEAAMRQTLATTYLGLARFQEAEAEARVAVSLRERALGAAAEPTLMSRLSLADVLARQRRLFEAESLLALVSADLAALPETETSLHAGHAHLLGSILILRQQFTAADSLLSRAVALRRGRPETESSRLIASLDALSTLRAERNQLDAALPLAQEALAIARRVHPGDHHDVAVAAGHVATILRRQGRFAAAESLMTESIAIDRRVLGPDHEFLAQTLNNLGILLNEQGRFAESESVHREVGRIFAQALPADHPLLQSSWNNLATTLQSQGRLAEALPIRERVLVASRRIHGSEHEEVAIALNNVAAIHRELRRFPDALRAFEEARKIFVAVHGPDHPNSVIALNNIGRTHLDARQFAAAERALSEATAHAARAFPAGHPNAAALLANHARALAGLGRRAEAEREFLIAHESLVKAVGAAHPRAREAARSLAELYGAWGRGAEQRRWLAAAAAS